MAMNPADGVVDPKCRVFDFQNLFIAGSSVFCTAGQANPTFPAVALAMRLAAHLDRNIQQLGRSPGAAQIPAHLKILHVLPSIDAASGGPSRAVFDLALAARRRGHAVTICATNYGGQSVDHAECLKAGVKVVVFPVLGPDGLQYSPGMQSYLRQNLGSFDIVHLHSLYLPHDWMVHRYALQYHVPYILRPHGTFDPVVRNRKRLRKWVLDKALQDRVNEDAAGIHYTSDDERSLSNCTKDQSWVIPLPIGMEEFHGQDWDTDFKSRHGIRGEYILFLGRLAWKKGADILIRAFAEFLVRQPDVELVIAGPDFGEVKKLQHLAQNLGIDSHVHFTGMLNGPARVAAYRLAKVFAVPSRGENFGRTVTEAMVVGTPIVMTDRIGIWKEVVREDVALVVEADVKSVCRGLWAVWDAYPDAIARAARATEFVKSHFGLDTVGETLERMYFDALAVTRKEQQASPFGIGPS
jgi:glycosyltransferase involved in cell wall biosynthesis